jgi:ABC-type xylose transport system permease subunit
MTRLTPWETGLLVVFLLTLALNVAFAPEFLTVQNQINLFQLSIEKIIVALVMTLVIINAEIDLSVASVMGLSAAAFGFLVNAGWGGGGAILVCLLIGLAAGALVNAALSPALGIPSLVVTLAMLIGFRGLARVLVKDNSLGDFPAWFTDLGQKGLIGPVPLSLILLFFALLILLGRDPAPFRLRPPGHRHRHQCRGRPLLRPERGAGQDRPLPDLGPDLRLCGLSTPPASARSAATPLRVRAGHHHHGPAGRVSASLAARAA